MHKEAISTNVGKKKITQNTIALERFLLGNLFTQHHVKNTSSQWTGIDTEEIKDQCNI